MACSEVERLNALNCRNHPVAGAAGVCRTCSLKFCGPCLVEVGGEDYCEDCARDAQGPASAQSIASLIAGLLGLAIPLVTGFILPLFPGMAVLLGLRTMREVSRGQSPAAGKKYGQIGLGLGLLGIVLWRVLRARVA
jgi:hypothetical protein